MPLTDLFLAFERYKVKFEQQKKINVTESRNDKIVRQILVPSKDAKRKIENKAKRNC